MKKQVKKKNTRQKIELKHNEKDMSKTLLHLDVFMLIELLKCQYYQMFGNTSKIEKSCWRGNYNYQLLTITLKT